MIELPLVFLGGFLGSSHCIGMCGGFALMVGWGHPSWRRNLMRQLSYSAGRVSTYCGLGAVAGFLGMRLAESTRDLANIPAALCLLAGLFLVVEGLAAAGFNLRGRGKSGPGGCLLGGQFASILRGPGLQTAFAAGVLTGFLPCGLVYAFLALAASTGSMLWGAVIMATFGLGTVPLMVLTGTGASMLRLVTRLRMMRVAAWCVVLTGTLTIARGAGFLRLTDHRPPTCPWCVDQAE